MTASLWSRILLVQPLGRRYAASGDSCYRSKMGSPPTCKLTWALAPTRRSLAVRETGMPPVRFGQILVKAALCGRASSPFSSSNNGWRGTVSRFDPLRLVGAALDRGREGI